MNAGAIRGWLLRAPKPALVRVTVDDDVQEVKLNKSYAKTADTIAALEPDLIECLDKDGAVLRAMRADSADARRSEAAAIPPGLESDPQAMMLVHFSNQIHRAYEHATEVAFSKMVEVFDIMSARSESIEQRLERAEAHNRRLINEQVEDAFERAEETAAGATGKEGIGEQILGAFLGGQQMPAPAPVTNGKSNVRGKGAS